MSSPHGAGREPVRLTFHGASGTVTGSKYLIEHGNQRILVDCGLFQGRKELRERNWADPTFDPTALDAIVLTHAHIDHTGFLPLVVRRGYRGPIYCTEATAELLQLLLPDSAHLQEEEARFAESHRSSKHRPPKPLYTVADAKQTLQQLRVIERSRANTILPGVVVHARTVGHILGAVSLNIDIGGRRITFSGDVGRYGVPILPDPEGIELGDLLLCESTYGDRDHETGDPQAALGRVVNRAVERGGALIIPAFAIGRTQNLLYELAELERKAVIPVLPIFVDSPMAVDATYIYKRFHFDYDEDAAALLAAGKRPLVTERTVFCHSVEQSKRLNFLEGPRIIISASGMATGGRILHHLMHHLPESSSTVLLVGYQAEQTRGQRLQAGEREIKIFGKFVPVKARVETIDGLSAHGDRGELLRWLRSCTGRPGIVRIVHGEPQASASFATLVNKEFGWNAHTAKYLETVEL